MKRFTLFVALLIMVGTVVQAQTPGAVPTPPAAQTAPPKPAGPPGTGIGVLIFSTVLLESDPGKAAVEKINKAMEPAKVSFEKAAKEADELQKKLQSAKTDAEKNSLTRELDSKARAVKVLQEDAQALSESLQEQYFPPIGMLINKIVEEYARDSNLGLCKGPENCGARCSGPCSRGACSRGASKQTVILNGAAHCGDTEDSSAPVSLSPYRPCP